MNYYLELLESYSKLKKRSLKLIKEQEGDRQMVSTAAQVVQIGKGAGEQYIKLLHPDGKQKLSVGKQTSKSGNVLIRARFGGHSWGTPIADETGASTGSQLQGYGELEQWLRGAGKPASTGGNEEENKEQSDKDVKADAAKEATDLANSIKQQEAAEAQQQELNRTTLAPLVKEIGYVSTDPKDDAVAEFGDEYDFFTDEEDELKSQFIEDTNKFVNDLIEDVTVDLEKKREALTNLKEMVGVAASIRSAKKRGGKKWVVHGTLSSRLDTLKKSIATTSRSGEWALIRPDIGSETLESDILTTGRVGSTSKGTAMPAFTKLKAALTSGVKRHNKAIKDKGSKHFIEEGWHEVQVERNGTAGSDANRRSKIDEGLIGAAGILHALGGVDGAGVTPDRREFLIGKFKEGISDIMGDDSINDVAAYLNLGLDRSEDIGVTTLLTGNAEEFADALRDRMMLDLNMEGEEATDFLRDVGTDGQRVLALTLLLRYEVIKDIFGDLRPDMSVVVGARGERKTGRKVDNAFLFSADEAKRLVSHLNTLFKQEKGMDHYTETKTIKQFKKEGLLTDSDFQEGYNENEKVTMYRFSLKTHNNHGSDSSQGSARASAVVIATPESTPFRKDISKAIDSVVASPEDAEGFNNFINTCRSLMYDEKGKPRDGSEKQNEAFWAQVRTHSQDLTEEKRKEFQKALSVHLLLLGGGSRANQANIVSYMAEGDYTVQDDHTFRKDVIEKIKDNTWKIKSPLTEADSSIISIGPEVGGKVKTLLKINGTGERVDVWKTASYQKELLKKQSNTPETENSSILLRQFLSAQAQMIQELLAK